jgi:hypothetical protein
MHSPVLPPIPPAPMIDQPARLKDARAWAKVLDGKYKSLPNQPSDDIEKP